MAPIHCYFSTEVYVAMKKVASDTSTLFFIKQELQNSLEFMLPPQQTLSIQYSLKE